MKKTLKIFSIILLFLSISPKDNFSQTGYTAVLEFCTGTWCQWCPCGDSRIEDILQNFPNTVVLAYHGAGNDPWQNYSSGIRGLFGFNSYPTGVVGRRSGIISYDGWNNEVVLQSLLVQPGVNINVASKSYDNTTRTLTANIDMTANTTLLGDYYIMLILTENNLIYPQTGNSQCAGNTNYVHMNTVKSMINGDLGDLVSSGTWSNGQLKTKSLNYILPNSPQVVNPDNCELNIFVYKQGTSIASNYDIQQSLRTSVTGTVGITNQNTNVVDYSLSQNYPNPFNPTTHFNFSIPKSQEVSLKIYDILGNEVATYVDGFLNAGNYSVEFDGSNLSSGIYFYKLVSGEYTQTRKMNLIK